MICGKERGQRENERPEEERGLTVKWRLLAVLSCEQGTL